MKNMVTTKREWMGDGMGVGLLLAPMKRVGLLASAVLSLSLGMVGCQGQESASEASLNGVSGVSSAATQKVVEDAVLSGRLATFPENLQVQTLPVSSRDMAAYESSRTSKVAQAVSRPTESAEEAGARIRVLHEAVPLSNDVRLSLTLARDGYVLGEPVTIRATLTNVTDHALRFPPLLDPQFQYNNFLITTPSGKTLGFSPVAIACSRGELQYQTLQPGESRTEDLPIFFHKDGWVFSEPGDYTIQALFRSTAEVAQRADSNRVHLTVMPGDADDQAAARLMMGHDQGLFMMWGEGDHLEEGIDALRTVINTYPETTAALYARYALASNMSVDFMDGRFQKERKAVPSEVLAYLLPVVSALRSSEAPVLSPDMIKGAWLKSAEAYRQLGKKAEARALLNDFLRVEANNPVLSDADLRQVSEALSRI